MPLLLDIHSYKHEDLTQLLLVAMIFGAFSMSGVVAILIRPNRDRLNRFLFLALSVASLAFIFVTALNAVLLPATARKANMDLSPETIRTLGALCDGVVWAVIPGAMALVTAIGSFGFTFSRRLGFVTRRAADTVVIIWFCYYPGLSAALS